MCSFGSTPAYNPVYNCNRVKTFLCALQSTFLLWWFPQTMDQLVHHHSKDRGSSGTSVLEPNMPVPSQGKAVLKLKLQQWLKVVKCAPNGWGNVQFKNRTIWVWNFCANLPPCQVYTLPQYISNLLMVSIHLCFQQSIYFFKSWSCKPRICQLLEIYLRSLIWAYFQSGHAIFYLERNFRKIQRTICHHTICSLISRWKVEST